MLKTDPMIKQFKNSEEAITYLLDVYEVLAFKEDFVKARKQRILTIHVAAVGYENISIYNPEYRVFWFEPFLDVVHTLYRVAKSPTARRNIWREAHKCYENIAELEYCDAFERQVHETNSL